MKDYKSKEFFARQRQTAKDTERDEMEQHCSHRAMEWGQASGVCRYAAGTGGSQRRIRGGKKREGRGGEEDTIMVFPDS